MKNPVHREQTWSAGTLTYTRGGLGWLFFWLLWGDFAWAMRDRVIPPVMQLLFKQYEVSDTMAGLLFTSFPITLGLLTGPFICYMSDRHRGKWGRRIPYIFVTTPFIVVSIIGMALSPWLGAYAQWLLGPGVSLNVSVLMFLAFFCLVFEFFCGTANMLYGSLVNDVAPPQVLGRFFGLFRAVSLIVGAVFSYWLFGHAEANYVWYFIGIGILYGAGFSMMCLNVKEGDYPEPPAIPQSSLKDRFLTAAGDYIKTGYGNSYYLWFFAVSILANLVNVPVNLYNVFYAKSLGMDMNVYGACLAASFVVSLCLAYPLGWLSDRFHPLRMVMVALAGYMLGMAWAFLFVCDAATFGVALMIHCVIGGSLFTVLLSLPQKLLPRDQFAQISSAGGTLGCLVSIVFAPALGMFLDFTDHAYRYTFAVAFIVTVLALMASLILHRKFMVLGGPENYQAPK
ncbi:MAG: MFS transporter [Candidatus Methylacidiphilales bacterium]|nr:MFS transporter [Candidatus Methylacidiphilales bacterium]